MRSLIKPVKKEPIVKKKTVKDLQLFDDIWIKEDDDIYKGWIWDISRRCITVVYGEDLRDFRFQIPKPMTAVMISQDNKILYCNNPKDDN